GRYADIQDDAFAALNTAFTLNGLFVYVPKGRILERPLHILNLIAVGDDAFLQPRHLFVFEEASQARVIESSHVSSDTHTMTNSLAEVYVGKRSVVDMFLIQDEGERASAVTNTHVYQDELSVFSVHTLTLSGDVVRNNLTVVPNAEFCETHLYGLFMPTGRTHVDNHTLVDHASPNCVSNELYKGVLDDASSGVFNGKVFVRPDAQKVNAFQENKTILLTRSAIMNAKPELEIYADDVKCSHGATTGQLDKEALFYLRSRGIAERQARGMLLHAFVGDVLEKISVRPLRDAIDRRVSARFGW
ncbi:MAG: Fe-S cluster assembly protein SufD, partial [Rhodothermales bacterium]